ncbi:hypothetical protein LK429_12230 [Hoylesella buccalis]|uniref:hypothetical protein n=1 Tax=Hoylesella buccalis TaxID=28127 RepID=UPI00058EC92F|nr:hypothetical protein [Hoylesella buccalis]MCB6902082.1 hypothetical protein [Hoylesella buccalis]UEA62777.1 hypothetical protein LK429_12230 [Hoylesella buccalis]UWP49936.1 hypothetical protein NQ518_02410 [Hoylesella buccalis ATCC 35310]
MKSERGVNALTGAGVGAITGAASGFKYARDNKVNPWTGKKYISNDVIQKFNEHAFSNNRHEDIGISKSDITSHVEDFVIKNKFNLREGSNTFQGTINGIQKSLIINVHNGQIRSLNLFPGYSNRPTANPIIKFGELKW